MKAAWFSTPSPSSPFFLVSLTLLFGHRNNHRLRLQRNYSTEVQRKHLGDGIAREHGERPSYAVWRGISDIDADQPVGEDRCFVVVTATLS